MLFFVEPCELSDSTILPHGNLNLIFSYVLLHIIQLMEVA